MTEWRIGCVPYLNGLPLVAWFRSGQCTAPVDLRVAVPSVLAGWLRDGLVDAALVSVFELFTTPGLSVAPGISIGSDGPVQSVRLLSKVPFPAIRSVALDQSSLTSAALARILMEEIHGCRPKWYSRAPDIGTMLRAHDAALVIGDLRLFDAPTPYVMDLGEAWRNLTGLPFVYAAWLVRDVAHAPAVVDALAEAKRWGMGQIERLSPVWAAEAGLPLDRVQSYFRDAMRYDLDDRMWRGLLYFREKCLEHGVLVTARIPYRCAQNEGMDRDVCQ